MSKQTPRRKFHQGNQDENRRYRYTHVALTPDEIPECIEIRIGEITHYLHSDTALLLRNRLTEKLEQWDSEARSIGHYGLPHRDESIEDWHERLDQWKLIAALDFAIDFQPDYDKPIPDDARL